MVTALIFMLMFGFQSCNMFKDSQANGDIGEVISQPEGDIIGEDVVSENEFVSIFDIIKSFRFGLSNIFVFAVLIFLLYSVKHREKRAIAEQKEEKPKYVEEDDGQ